MCILSSKKLIDKKACFIWESLQEKYRHKTETFITLQPSYHTEAELEKLLNEWTKAPKQLELLLAYLHLSKTEGEVTQNNLLKKSGASAVQLKGLIEKGIIQVQKRSVDRIRQLPQTIHIDFALSISQQQALHSIKKKLGRKTGLFIVWCYCKWKNANLYSINQRSH